MTTFNMQQIYCICIFAVMFCYCCCASPTPPDYPEECKVLDNVTRNIVAQGGVQMHCLKNPQCTGFGCQGKYVYSGRYTEGTSFNLEFCFGIALHPCSTPLNMELYMVIPAYQQSFEHTVYNDATYLLPGVHYEQKIGGTTVYFDGFLKVNMEPRPRAGKNYVKIGVKLMVRVKSLLGETYPEPLQRYLMPNTTIPVPPCDRHVHTPTHAPNTCSLPSFPPSMSTPPMGGGPSGRPAVTTLMPPMKCDPHDILNLHCDTYEVCTATGYCVCKHPGRFENGKCVVDPGFKPAVPTHPASTAPKKKKVPTATLR